MNNPNRDPVHAENERLRAEVARLTAGRTPAWTETKEERQVTVGAGGAGFAFGSFMWMIEADNISNHLGHGWWLPPASMPFIGAFLGVAGALFVRWALRVGQ